MYQFSQFGTKIFSAMSAHPAAAGMGRIQYHARFARKRAEITPLIETACFFQPGGVVAPKGA